MEAAASSGAGQDGQVLEPTGPTPSGSTGLMMALVPLWARWDEVIQAGGLAPCEPLKMSLTFWGLLLSALLQQPLQVQAPQCMPAAFSAPRPSVPPCSGAGAGFMVDKPNACFVIFTALC